MAALTNAGASVVLIGLGALPLILGVGVFADSAFPMHQIIAAIGVGLGLIATLQATGAWVKQQSGTWNKPADPAPAVPLAVETMLRTMLADGRINAAETSLVCDAVRGLTGVRVTERDILRQAQDLRGANHRFIQELGDRRYDLDDSGREVIVKAAYLAMMADGKITNEEGWIVDRVYEELMPRRRLEDIIADLDPWMS